MKKRLTIFVLGIILLIGFNYFINKNNLLENVTKDISYKITRLFSTTKEINLSKDMLISKNDALEKEIVELSKLLKLNEITATYNIINATIINRNMEEFYDTVIINKGYNDGVDIGYAVINNDGLIGKVIKLGKETSTVKLLTSSDLYNMLSVNIHTSSGDIYGILSDYDEETNSFIIEGIDELTKIEVGDIVSTTGLENNYPNGINIGKVVRISKDNFDLAYILKVEPYIDFNNFHYVAVLDRHDS
jgi:rod shape-determining protein MreC